MIKFGIHIAIAGLFLLSSCGVENIEAETNSTGGKSNEPSYVFKDGEQIHWETSREGDFVIIRAWLNTDWNTYSVFNTNFLGPLPTLISFEENSAYELDGEILEVGLETKFDEESESEIGYFRNMATFKQKIKLISGEEFVLKGNVNYMVCNATKCLPPADYNFELTIKP